MKRFSLIAVFVVTACILFSAPQAHAQATLVQHCRASSNSVTCANTIGAGHMLLVYTWESATTPTTTYADGGDTFTPIATNIATGLSGRLATVAFVPNTGGFSATVTATITGSPTSIQMSVDEYSKGGSGVALDQSDFTATGNSNSISSASVTPTQSGELIVGIIFKFFGAVPTVGTNVAWALTGTDNRVAMSEFFNETAATAITAQATNGDANGWLAGVVTFTQPPYITGPTPALVSANGTLNFTASTGGITWTCARNGGACLGSINSGTGVYTAPATITVQHHMAGCQGLPNESIYNFDISGQSVDTNSATWMAQSGVSSVHALNFQGMIPWLNWDGQSGTAQTLNLTVNSGVSGTYKFLQVPDGRAQDGWWNYHVAGTADHHTGTILSTCQINQMYNQASSTSAGAANSVGITYAQPVNQGVDAGGTWMSMLDMFPSELAAAVAAGRSNLGHALRMALTNAVICNSSVANTCENAGGTRHIWPATSEAFIGGGLIPYGACLHLKNTFDISTFTAAQQVILNNMQHFCTFMQDGTDNNDSFTLGGGYGFQLYDLSAIKIANVPLSNFEFLNIQSLKTANNSTQVLNAPDVITATNGAGSGSAPVILQGVTLGLPYPENVLYFQAGGPSYQIKTFVNGSANQAVTCTMSPTLGVLTSGCLYTPPASVATLTGTTVTVTASASASAVGVLYLDVFPTGNIRMLMNGSVNGGAAQCGTITVPAYIPIGGGCTNGPFTDSLSHVWQGTPMLADWQNNNCGGSGWTFTDAQIYFSAGASYSGDLVIPFILPNGTYKVIGYFAVGACSYNSSPGQQKETIEIQGTPVLTNLDIAATAGTYTPLVETFPNAVVNNGVLTFALRNTGLGAVGPTISALEIDAIPPAGSAMTSGTVISSKTALQ